MKKYTDTDYIIDTERTLIYKHAKAYAIYLAIEELKKMGATKELVERFEKRMRKHE